MFFSNLIAIKTYLDDRLKSDLHVRVFMCGDGIAGQISEKKTKKKKHDDRTYRRIQAHTHTHTDIRFGSFKLMAATAAAAAKEDTTRMCARCLCECIIFIPNKWPAAKFTVAFYKKIICVYHFRKYIMCARWRRWRRRRPSSQATDSHVFCLPCISKRCDCSRQSRQWYRNLDIIQAAMGVWVYGLICVGADVSRKSDTKSGQTPFLFVYCSLSLSLCLWWQNAIVGRSP